METSSKLIDIPKIYESCITHHVRARMRLGQMSGNAVHRSVVLCVTVQSSLLCFEGGGLVFAVRIPFTECKRMFVYRTQLQDFIAVVSETERTCVVVDPLKQSVIKKWTGITDASPEVAAEVGSALVLDFEDSSVKRFTERNWDDSTSLRCNSPAETSNAVKVSVNKGLQKQLTSTQQHVNLLEERNWHLETSLRRNLTFLEDSLQRIKHPCHNVQPTYSVPVLTGLEKASIATDQLRNRLDLQISPLWQNIHDDRWIIGCAVYNNSHTILKNVIGLLISRHCRTNYYKFKSSTTRDAEPLCKLLKTEDDDYSARSNLSAPWDGTLEPGHSVWIILLADLPDFRSGDRVESSVFLTCQDSEGILQLCLGRIEVRFQDYLQGNHTFESSNSGFAWEKRFLVGLSSLLPFRTLVYLAARRSSVEDVLSDTSSTLELRPLPSCRTFYWLGKPQLVLVKCGEPQRDRIELEISCKSERDCLLFLRTFASVLPDDCLVLPAAQSLAPDHHLRWVAALDTQLSSVLRRVQARSAEEDDVAESPGESHHVTSDLQQLRQRFLQRNKTLKTLYDSGRQQHSRFHIGASDYKLIRGMFDV